MRSAWRTGLSLALIGIAAASVFCIAYFAVGIPGNLRWLLSAAGVLVIAGAGLQSWPRRFSTPEIKAQRAAVDRMETALQERAERIARRHRELTRQLMQIHEWTEFPGADPARPERDETPGGSEDLGEKDRAVAALLEKRTEVLFEKIKANAYQADGVFQRERLVEDLIGLVEDVARIYNPASKRPLLETSVERLLRAANRISLQLLLLLEGLPLDIKSYNLQTSYETIRKGIKAYGVYKSAEPYLSFARPFYYLGRYAVGAAPAILGAGWAVSELVKTGARRFSTSMANRYALGLIGDMVLIIGGEAAGVFGGDYRHRDPGWIYGAELTEGMAACPPSKNLLRAALEEISALALRNEYDRIFLYRCLASGVGSRADRFADPSTLSLDQREAVAKRLERFYRRHIRRRDVESGNLTKWQRSAEERLGVKMRLAENGVIASSSTEKTVEALVSLAGFLSEVKECDIEKWPEVLSGTRLLRSLEPPERDGMLAEILAAPPMVFDYPDLDPDDLQTSEFLSDIIDITVRIYPRSREIDAKVADAARYFRTKEAAVQKRLDRAYVDFLSGALREDSPERRVGPHAAKSLLYMTMEDESPRFLYGSVSIETDRSEPLPFPPWAEPRLMGTDRRLVLLAVNRKIQSPPILVWSAEKPGDGTDAAMVSRLEGRFRNACRLTGGAWHWDRVQKAPSPPEILVTGPTMARRERFFKPLIDFFESDD